MPKLNRNERKLALAIARAAYVQAHIHLKEGKVKAHLTPSDSAEDAAKFFANVVGQAAGLAAEEIVREFEQLPFMPERAENPRRLFG